MTPSRGVVLAKNVSVVANQAQVNWEGGRASLVVVATTYPTAVNFQLLAPDGATWINMNAATIAANGATSYDCPAGQYRLAMSGGTAAGLYASLVTCPTA